MAVDRFGNTVCDVCHTKIFNGIPHANRKIGNDGYAMCSPLCLEKFEIMHRRVEEEIADIMAKPDRLGADEQKGWKWHRWWNQAYKRKLKVLDQWKTNVKFKMIQWKARL